jgi:hypothetical protein
LKKYLIILPIFIFILGCGRTGSEKSGVGTSGTVVSGGNIIFDVRSKSKLVDKNGNSYVDKGHYSMLVQSKDKKGNPIGNLTTFDYTLYENNVKSAADESKVIFDHDPRSTTNKILLLLDFSGSLISDCDNISVVSSNNKDNLCYQLIESAKQFVDDTVNAQQSMAIYYFNSKTNITPLVTSSTASSTTDKAALKNGLMQLYDANFRENNLKGYDSTNLNGAVIEATKVACHWVGSCNYDIYTPQSNTNLESFEFASIVVFTDGRDLANRVSEGEMISFINRHKSLYYYTIGLGDVDENTLRSIGRDKYIPVSKNSDLNGAFDDLSVQLKSWGNSFYKIDYCPASQEGSVDIKIKIESGSYTGVITDAIRLPENVDFRCDL